MFKRIISVLLVLIPFVGSAQAIHEGDPEYDRIVKDDCGGAVFTKYEELPNFKISKQAFEDSLTLYLKANQVFDPNTKFTLLFLLTKRSQIIGLTKLRGPVQSHGFLKAVLHYSKLWVPAKNNSREVCALVKCDVEVKQDRVVVTVFQ